MELIGVMFLKLCSQIFTIISALKDFFSSIFFRKLDYEANPIHDFKIFATDHGVPPNTAVAYVKILLKNLNDKKPVFPTDPKELNFKVTEMAEKGTFVGNLKVQDPDGDEVCFYFGKYIQYIRLQDYTSGRTHTQF